MKHKIVASFALIAVAAFLSTSAQADSGYRVTDDDGVTSYQEPTRPKDVPWYVPKMIYDATHPSRDMKYLEMRYYSCTDDRGNDRECKDGVQDGPFANKAECEAQLRKDEIMVERVGGNHTFECSLQRNDW